MKDLLHYRTIYLREFKVRELVFSRGYSNSLTPLRPERKTGEDVVIAAVKSGVHAADDFTPVEKIPRVLGEQVLA